MSELQELIDAARTRGDTTIPLEAKVYRIDEPLVLYSGQQLDGATVEYTGDAGVTCELGVQNVTIAGCTLRRV